jgi:hypothetical protein
VISDPVTSAPPFARSQGAEFGVGTGHWRGLQATSTLWYLHFDCELIYVPDPGSTDEGPPSRRYGLELNNIPNLWMAIDLDIFFSPARSLTWLKANTSCPAQHAACSRSR